MAFTPDEFDDGPERPPAKVIWDRSGNPSDWVSEQLGIMRWQLRDAIHKIKARSGLAGGDDVIIHSDGRVTDRRGDDVGNIHDEI